MNLLRPIAALLLLLVACEPVPNSGIPSTTIVEPSAGGSSERHLSFPGGGRILFVRSAGPGYDWGSVGLLTPDGTMRSYPRGPHAFPYWDPAAPDRLLMLPYGEPVVTRSLQIVGDSLHLVGSWRTSELWTFPSLDGRTIAFVPLDRSGHRYHTDLLRSIDRSTGATRTISSLGLTPLAWTPGRELLAVPRSGGQVVRWNPWTGETHPFGSGYGNAVWGPSGRRFAANGTTRGPATRGVVVIGGRRGRVTDRVWMGAGSPEIPTWSPDGTRIAFIVRGAGQQAHRRSTLHVYDLTLGLDSVLAKPVSDAFWASWSPDGKWLLVDDWTRNRWLFVAAAGDTRFPYPWLGAYPRWCCPSSPPSSTPIPVS